MAKPKIRIGISGWRYPPWRGAFYPEKLRQDDELHYASRALPTIEINGSFYSMQSPKSYGNWYDATPDDFVFTMKAPRFITHIKRLKEVETPVANFLASGIFNLREKLGAILWQLPPNFKFNAELLETFLKLLPHDTEAALAMAQQHEERMSGRVALTIDSKRPLRHAMEIRNESFLDPQFVKLLRQYKVALVIADTAGKFPAPQDVTADFIYLRLHGASELYVSGYSEEALDLWADRIRQWTRGGQPKDADRISDSPPPERTSRDAFCFFDNTEKIHAPTNARRLLDKLGVVREKIEE